MSGNHFAVNNGALANKPQFFGSSTAELTSISFAGTDGGWNGGETLNPFLANPWQVHSGQAQYGARAGALAFSRWTGNARNDFSHRTILLGY